MKLITFIVMKAIFYVATAVACVTLLIVAMFLRYESMYASSDLGAALYEYAETFALWGLLIFVVAAFASIIDSKK